MPSPVHEGSGEPIIIRPRDRLRQSLATVDVTQVVLGCFAVKETRVHGRRFLRVLLARHLMFPASRIRDEFQACEGFAILANGPGSDASEVTRQFMELLAFPPGERV